MTIFTPPNPIFPLSLIRLNPPTKYQESQLWVIKKNNDIKSWNRNYNKTKHNVQPNYHM